MTRSAPPPPDILAGALRASRVAIGSVAALSFGINVLMLAGPLYMLQVYDRVLKSGSVETLLVLTAILAAAYLTLVTLEASRTMIAARLGSWLTRALGPEYLDAALRSRLVGETGGAQALRDLGHVQSFVATQGMTSLLDLPWTPLFIAVIWLLHPWLGVLALGTAVALVLLGVGNELATRGLLRQANADQIASQRDAEAAVDNADPLWAMGMKRTFVARWEAANDDVQDAFQRASDRSAAITAAARFTRHFAQSGVLGLGAYLVLLGEVTGGAMIAASILLGRALAPLDMAMGAWKSFQTTRLAYDRLKTQARRHPPAARRMRLPTPGGGLDVTEVSTRAGAEGGMLSRITFSAEPGEAVAIIGPSGAGKSTLLRTLAGLARPAAGRIRLDGVDIFHFDPEQRGAHVGYLSQDVGLFAGTIRDNIARFGEASDEAVIEAARLAHAHEMILALPNGYATVLGPRGSGLSAGQRQRIGLARAVFGSPSLVLLDEPNANLDTSGESALAAAILDLKDRGATLVIVGHRPSTLTQSDKVLLLQNGAVQAFGPRAEVLDRMREASAATRRKAAREADGEPAEVVPVPRSVPTAATGARDGNILEIESRWM